MKSKSFIALAFLLMTVSASVPFSCQRASAQIRGPHRKIFSSSGGSIAVTCTGTGSYNGTTSTLTISPPTGSALIIGLATVLDANFTSLKDSNGVSLTQDNSTWVGNTDGGFVSFFHEAVSASITGVTATFAAGTNQISIEGCYVTGLANNAPDVIDNTGFNTMSGTTWKTGSITTTNAKDVVFGFVYDGNNTTTFSAASPYTLGDSTTVAGTYSAGIVYLITSSADAYQPNGTLTGAQGSWAIAGSYK